MNTWLTFGMSRPRAATSEATLRLERKEAKQRTLCNLEVKPWEEEQDLDGVVDPLAPPAWLTAQAAVDVDGPADPFGALNQYQLPDEAALPDLDRALALQPRHIPAMTGKGLTLIQMGRIREGQAVIRRAVALNPWLSERQYLLLEPESTDL